MARVRMVTRTIKAYNYEVLCLDVVTCETSINTYTLTGDEVDNEKALSTLQKLHNTSTFKLVNINTMTVSEEMYGMLETDFMKSAKKLDPQTRKELEV